MQRASAPGSGAARWSPSCSSGWRLGMRGASPGAQRNAASAAPQGSGPPDSLQELFCRCTCLLPD